MAGTYKNHSVFFERNENDLNQTSLELCSSQLIFRGVLGIYWLISYTGPGVTCIPEFLVLVMTSSFTTVEGKNPAPPGMYKTP